LSCEQSQSKALKTTTTEEYEKKRKGRANKKRRNFTVFLEVEALINVNRSFEK